MVHRIDPVPRSGLHTLPNYRTRAGLRFSSVLTRAFDLANILTIATHRRQVAVPLGQIDSERVRIAPSFTSYDNQIRRLSARPEIC